MQGQKRDSEFPINFVIISAVTLLILVLLFILKLILSKRNHPSDPNKPKNRKITSTRNKNIEPEAPTGIDKMMAEDFGHDATIEDIEALLEPKDEFENQLQNNAPTLTRADEILNSQKLDLNAILNGLQENDINNEE